MNRFIAKAATGMFAILSVVQASAEEPGQSVVLPRDPVTKRFNYVLQTYHPGYCFLRGDARIINKSPWLIELQEKLEAVLSKEAEVLKQNPFECKFDLAPSGQIVNLHPDPDTSKDTDQQNRSMQIIKEIGSVKPLKGELATDNTVTILLQFKSYPHCQMSQVLTPTDH